MRLSPSSRLDALLAPSPAPRRVAFLSGARFAHRGLHGPGVPENSRAAFAAAIAAGHGIECDVQASRDAQPIVFHDYELDRLTGDKGPLAARTGAELAQVRLANGEAPPPLGGLLELIGGRVPLLIEVKARDGAVGALCLGVRRALEGYRGPVAVMSFNPQVAHWFAAHAERIVRGLVVTEADDRGIRGRLRRHLALWRARPDFLAYDVRDLPSRFAAANRARGLPVLTWTVRGGEAEAIAAAHADAPIYEAG